MSSEGSSQHIVETALISGCRQPLQGRGVLEPAAKLLLRKRVSRQPFDRSVMRLTIICVGAFYILSRRKDEYLSCK